MSAQHPQQDLPCGPIQALPAPDVRWLRADLRPGVRCALDGSVRPIALGSTALGPIALGSIALGSIALGSIVLGSVVSGSTAAYACSYPSLR